MAENRFSVVLCSRDGAATLPATLEALARVEAPRGSEIILVDNASTDRTYELFPAKIGTSNVLRLKEPRHGKSFALNTGISAASGDYIVFIDDDARPEPDWLLAYEKAIRLRPHTLVFCGQVRPEYAAEAPDWLQHLSDLGRCCGATPTVLNDQIQPVGPATARGANLMIKRSALTSIKFDEKDYNYLPQSVGGEDTQIVQALTASGPPAVFVPSAVVHHHVSQHEMSIETILTRARRIGYNVERRESATLGVDKVGVARRLRSYRRKLTLRKIRLVFLPLVSGTRQRTELALKIAFLSGRADFLMSFKP